MSDIVAAIDALIDQQLATGPQDDYNADRYDKCWHCDRDWHGLPITERIADMYAIRYYDETYNAANDTSRTLCRGSDFIGPMPEEKRYDRYYGADRYSFAQPQLLEVHCVRVGEDRRRWWRLPRIPADAHLEATQVIGQPWRITMTVGGQRQTWTGQLITERRDGTTHLDVLAELAPDIGGTWEPITAPGSTRHPNQTALLQQTGPNPYDYQLHLNDGDRIGTVMPDGRIFTDTYRGHGFGLYAPNPLARMINGVRLFPTDDTPPPTTEEGDA